MQGRILSEPTAGLQDHLRARQIYAAEQNVEQALFGFIFVALLTTLLFHAALGPEIYAWFAGVVLLIAVRLPIARRITRSPATAARPAATVKFMFWSVISAAVMMWLPLSMTMRAEGFLFAYMLALGLGTFWCGSFVHAPLIGSSLAYMLSQLAVTTISAVLVGITWEHALQVMLFASGTGVALHVIRQQSALFTRSVLQQLDLERKTEVIGLLLKEHEDQSSDWLWETDERLALVTPSARFAQALGAAPSGLAGRSVAALLASPEIAGNAAALEELSRHLGDRRSFRDLFIPFAVAGAPRWFAVSGRPVTGEAGTGFRRVMADVTAAKLAEARVAHLAHHDALTDLPNRTSFRFGLDRALTRGSGKPLALISLDLDGFKPVNDAFGHPVGDALLIAVAGRLKAALLPGDTLARFGGDEFSIVTGRAEPDEVESLSRALIAALSEPFALDGLEVAIGASIGVAISPGDGTAADDLIKNADAALYRAKADGRGTFRFFAPEMDQRLQERQALVRDLRTALARGELALHYQPYVDARSGDATGCEALLRWTHPRRGMVSPADFVPLAEESGSIVPIGAWVIEEACRAAAGWGDGKRVSLNVSPVQFRERDLPDRIRAALERTGLPARRLEIEVTETVLVGDPDAALDILRRIRALGVRVALDDFGTGYSSLSYLRLFPFDKIKIDRSFVRELDSRTDSQVIVRAIRDIAKGLGMTITAEGVETEGQAEQLRLTGCDELQGYLFSRPKPAAELGPAFEPRLAA